MALRVGPRGLLAEVVATGLGCSRGLVWRLFVGLEDTTAMNNQLRTGADKGNPTV